MKASKGKVLEVDLTAETWREEVIAPAVYEQVLAGVGLGAYYLCRHIPAGADPLGPDNILGFTAGLLTGTGAVMCGRWMAVCKSPLTGGWGDSNCGGNLAPAIKQCGYDAIFFKGCASRPVYLYLDSKGPQIRDAAPYWGLDAVEAEESLIEACWVGKKKPAAAVIGPAGERVSLIAGISNDRGRYAARSGVGAVMGSKRLKGVVLAGTKPLRAEDPAGVKAISKEYAAKVRKTNLPGIFKGGFLPLMGKAMGSMKQTAPMDGMLSTMMLKRFGSIMNNTLSVPNGDAPLKNWSGSDRDYNSRSYRHLNPEGFIKRETRKYHCYSCIIGCGGVCRMEDIRDGRFTETHKPEYETAMAFGGLIMNRNRDTIFYINEILNRAGLDTISVGGTVAFAIECYERGLLTKEETGGLALTWGNHEAIVALVEKIAAGEEGIGTLLADGVKAAAARIGKGSEEFAVHAGGQELPMHDPKIDPILGTTYAADPTPGRHTTSSGLYYSSSELWKYVSWLPPFTKHPKAEEYEATEEEALKNRAYTSYKMVVDGAGACYYAMLSGVRHFRIFDYLNKAAGWEKTPDDYMEIGRRMQTLRQLFNKKHGVNMEDFRLHGRAAGHPPLRTGHNRGLSLNMEGMVPLYWQAWGWDPVTGYPTDKTLQELGLDTLLTQEAFDGE